MKNFIHYLTETRIIYELCKLRVKIASSRNKKHRAFNLSSAESFNFHLNENIKNQSENTTINPLLSYNIEIESELRQLLPPRRQWVKIGKTDRHDQINGGLITSNKKNFKSLIKTILKHKRENSKEIWLRNLLLFVKELRISVIADKYEFTTPIIYPKLKNKLVYNDKNPCRPISLFILKDRIVLSILNRYLSKLLDPYFTESSYAFRTMKSKKTSSTLTHHDCIFDIFDIQTKNEFNPLWVVECDMEKFFDTVNHEIVIKLFNGLFSKVEKDYISLNNTLVKSLFSKYLQSYCFNINVPKQDSFHYWDSYKIPNGEFEWVEKKLYEHKYYDKIDIHRIGIPQGGALSGLIANIVLDYADRKVLETNVNYFRFCDDMIIIHNDFQECQKAKEIYLKSLSELKLVPHDFVSNHKLLELKIKNGKSKIIHSPFWKNKSKGPYCWTSIEIGGFPWIGFVGYEIKYDGSIRVRKKSFEKELMKQQITFQKIVELARSEPRKGKQAFYESLALRLIGMSVGRFELRNYVNNSGKLCWKNGFKALSKNSHSSQQIKQLDRNRNKLLYKFNLWLNSQPWPMDNGEPLRSRQIIKYNKAFSYYFQVLENRRIS